ncbi:helix-turn-helix domain-containing protein [Candidiatus Paracoxiella cheracis]|uniref:helix-turn-helix domain-containing protein n=1 Tax=Candidiatus Paracoxiella cheracis TaxID=3405120 RepID=UPI003BF55B08
MTTVKTPSKVMKELAGRLKALRLRKKWSRQELADYADINVYSLKRFEATGHISLERFLSICFALGVMSEFDHILKPRERIDVSAWKVPENKIRQRGRRRSEVTV